MGMFGKLLGSVIDVALTPVEIAKDLVTCGGLVTDEDEPYTVTRLKKAMKKAGDAADDAADGDLL
jgi:hypothetical protein